MCSKIFIRVKLIMMLGSTIIGPSIFNFFLDTVLTDNHLKNSHLSCLGMLSVHSVFRGNLLPIFVYNKKLQVRFT